MVFSRKGAKAQRQTVGNRAAAFAPLRLCVRNLLLVLLTTPTLIYSQPQVRFPDLTGLENEVREQITSLQNSLAAALKDSKTSEAALSEVYGELGQAYHAYSLTASARECYLNANRLSPKEFRWAYLLAKLDHQEGRFDDALRRYQLARALRPDYVATLVNMGNIYLELNRLDDAQQSFKAALGVDPNNPAAHYGLGQSALSKRSYSEAVDHFQKTLKQVPAANRVHYSLAMAYRGLGDAAKARAHLAQQGTVGVRVSDPLVDGLQNLITGERVHLARGKVAFEAQRYEEAASEFRKAVASKPDSVTARINLGAALTQIGDEKGAVEQFEEAIRIEPGRVNAHYNLAVLLAKESKHVAAIDHLRSALNGEPNDQNVRLLLARELVKAERFDEALAEFARVVQADPNNESALIDHVKLLYRQKQFKQALEALEKGHAQYPQKGRTLVLLAYALSTSPDIQARNGTRALELAQRVYQATGATQHGALVAMALAELGRCHEAAEIQQRLISAEEKVGSTELLGELKSDLKQYENAQSCRSSGETSFPDWLIT